MIRLFFFALFFPIVCIFATEPDETFRSKKISTSTIFRLVTEQVDSIEYFDGEKLYLKSDNICHTNAGRVLSNGRSVIPLPGLAVNQNGHYLSCRSKEDFKLKCSNCGYVWWFSDGWSIYCPQCSSVGN